MKHIQFSQRMLHVLLLLLALASSVLTAHPGYTEASGEPHIVRLSATATPALSALSARYPTIPGEIGADEALARESLQSAIAVTADLAALDATTLRQSHWFQLAQEQDVPIILAHATAEQMAAVTGLGYGGDLVLLRSHESGRRVGVYVLVPSGAEAAIGTARLSSATPAITDRIADLLNGAAPQSAPVPQPDTLPVRMARVWDVETESPRTYLPDPYTFTIVGTNQRFMDDVRFSVGVYSGGAADQSKYVAIATAGGSGVSATLNGAPMTANSTNDRGYYLESYDVTIGPKDSNQTLLQIENRAPQAQNSDGTFATSTGWSIGISTDGPNVAYNQTDTASVSLKDFTVKLFGTPTLSHWTYALSSVGNGHPYTSAGDLLDTSLGIPQLFSLPGLATGQVLMPSNQVIYKVKGTPNGNGGVDAYQGTLAFKVAHYATFRRVMMSTDNAGTPHVQSQAYVGPIESAEFPVDFSMVNYRGDLQLGNDDIAIEQDPALSPGFVWLTALVHSDLASYDGVKVTFNANTGNLQTPIGTARVNIAALGGEGQRRGQALARVQWNIAGLAGTQNVTVAVENEPGESNLGNNSVTRAINITTPRLVISKAAFSLAEGGPSATYQVSLSTQPTSNVVVAFISEGYTTLSPNVLLFSPATWNTPQTVTISATDDDVVQGTHTSSIITTFDTTDLDYRSMHAPPIVATVDDNDNASPSSLKLFRGGARSSYQFVLNRKPTATVSISITADVPVAMFPSSLTFSPADWDTPQTVVVQALASGASGDIAGIIHHRANSADLSYRNVPLANVQVALRDPNNPAAVINVTSNVDEMSNNGQCSLREAVAAADANGTIYDCITGASSYHVINMVAPGPYDLTYAPDPNFPWIGSIQVHSEVIINGKSQTIRNRNATGLSRHFTIKAGGDLTLNDLTLRDGVDFGGGSIYVETGGTANLVHSTLDHNGTYLNTFGGAIVNIGRLNIIDSAITDNSSNGQSQSTPQGGGAINNTGILNIANSTLSGNRSVMDGGAIDNNLGVTHLTNVTITGNTADSDNDGIGDGGGIVVASGSVIIKNSIIAGNFDTPNNGGSNMYGPDIANRSRIAMGIIAANGPIFSAGNNLIGNVGQFIFANNAAGDRFGDPLNTTAANLGAQRSATALDPLLGSLAGMPAYHPLQPTSQAIDRIAAQDCTYSSTGLNPLFLQNAPVDHDQRGDARPHGFRCDSGAYELAQPGIDISVTALDVPTGQFGSLYAIVLKTRPTSNVTVDLTTDGTTSASPAQLVFTPDTWNVPQRVTVIARRSTLAAGMAQTAAPGAQVMSTIHHQVTSADPTYTSATLADLHATIVPIGNSPSGGPPYAVYLPLVQR